MAPAYGGDKVVVGESGLGYGSANVACSSKYLERSIEASGKGVLETHHPDKLLWRILWTWRVTARGKLELAGGRHGGRVRRYPRGRYLALIFHDTDQLANGTTAVVVQSMDNDTVAYQYRLEVLLLLPRSRILRMDAKTAETPISSVSPPKCGS